ncbi:MAG: molybdopterin-guanine dinucleotide biosynthesis protein A [Pseudomonadota bacterium]
MARLHLLFIATIVALGMGAGLVLNPAVSLAQEIEADDARHAGFYYPEPDLVEAYKPRSRILPDSDRLRRVGFVTLLTTQQMASGTPRLAIFAKGAEAEKLIIVALQDGYMDTLYRSRAVLAMLTAVARSTPLLQEMNVADRFTFLDLIYLMGFTQMTISDGDELAHTIVLSPDAELEEPE